MAERKLASIRKIESLHPIEGADVIERAVIDGWNVVVKKGEFSAGDLCVYFEVDSLLPEWEEFEFLRKSSCNEKYKAYRLKTAKLRGVISQGLALPIKTFDDIFEGDIRLGDDVTEDLEVEKYEPPIPVSLAGDVKGKFPAFIPKTDEERIQNVPNVLERHSETEFVITEKVDGTSATYYLNHGEFGFCGRNWEFKLTTQNTYYEVAQKYRIREKLEKLGLNIAIQGEILGPGIQGNKYNFDEHKLFLFHAYDIDQRRYLDHDDFQQLCKTLEIDSVPEVGRISFKRGTTVQDLLDLAEGMSYLYKTNREGIVIKSLVEDTDPELGRLSFKVISNRFLLKHGE